MKITAILALLFALSSQSLAHGPAVFVPAGGGGPSSQPTPDPAPAPSPRPVPAGGPGGGLTGKGGQTPTGGQTPGKGHGNTGARPRKHKGFDRTTRALLGAVVLEWQASYLPREKRPGYDPREYSVDQAVKGHGGDSAWALESKPTLVMLYDPGRTADMVFLTNLDDHPEFVAASYYFNLIRVDIRTIDDDDKKKKHKRGQKLVVYDAKGYRTSTIQGPVRPATVVDKLKPVITKDFGKDGKTAIDDIEDVLVRKAVLKNQLQLQEARLIDPRTGRRNQGVSDRVRRIRRELHALNAEAKALTSPKRGDDVP